jgi:hypothetical protein
VPAVSVGGELKSASTHPPEDVTAPAATVPLASTVVPGAPDVTLVISTVTGLALLPNSKINLCSIHEPREPGRERLREA